MDELAALKHDIDRYVKITGEQATEIERLTAERLEEIRLTEWRVIGYASVVINDELLPHIDALTAERDALRVERDQWERNHEALQDKFDCNKTCGCAYDFADALCGYHSPRVIAAEARARAAETQLETAHVALKNLLSVTKAFAGHVQDGIADVAIGNADLALSQPKGPTT